jgi:hypothetical protein
MIGSALTETNVCITIYHCNLYFSLYYYFRIATLIILFDQIITEKMDNKQFLMQQMLWIGISLGISITISMIVPFPFSLVIIIGIFILLNFYMRNRMMKKMGTGMGMFGSFSSPFAGNSVNYYCMSCGTKHREAACPRCGSKMKRVG